MGRVTTAQQHLSEFELSLRLIQKPSHSPELNPAEHLREESSQNSLPNKVYTSLDAVEQAPYQGLRDVNDNPE